MMGIKTYLSSFGLSALVMGCGLLTEAEKDLVTDASSVLEEINPADTTNTMTSVALYFESLKKLETKLASLLVTEEESPGLKISDQVTLTYAKFNIAKIKFKAERDPNSAEKSLEQQENSEEKATVEGLEQAIDKVALQGAGQPSTGSGPKVRRDEARKQVNERRDELKKNEFERLEKEVNRDKATKFRGPYTYDAILGRIEGETPKVDLVDGLYKRVEFQLKRNFSAEDQEPIFGNVFAIRGSFIQGEKITSFEIDWNVALNFRLLGDRGTTIKAGEDNSIIIDFNLQQWFEGIDFSQASIAEDGVVYINKTVNQSIMRQLHKNIKISSGFGKDQNKDGRISAEERAGAGQETVDAELSE